MLDISWESFVRASSMRYGGMTQTPEKVMKDYHDTNKRLEAVRRRLKNPVSMKGGGPLKPASIQQLERQEKELIQQADDYRILIKRLVKYELLPTSKLISGGDRKKFVFSLQTMVELPEFGKAVYYANQLLGSRYDCPTPSTNDGYVQKMKLGMYTSSEQGVQSRESMYDNLVNALNETIERVKKERQGLLFSGEPWKPPKNDPTIDVKDLKKDQNEIEAGWKLLYEKKVDNELILKATIARLEADIVINEDNRRRNGQERPKVLLGPEFEAFLNNPHARRGHNEG